MSKKKEQAAQPQVLTTKDFTNLIRKHADEYSKANRKAKKELLDRLEVVVLRPRDSIARTLRLATKPKLFSIEKPNKHIMGARGRPIIYTPEVDEALAYIWEAYSFPCAARLHPIINEAVTIFKRDDEWTFSEPATNLLLRMPESTMRPRLVKLAHKHNLSRGFSTTQASLIKELVPTFYGDWKDKPLGYGQIDTVVHAGGELIGVMAYTVNYVDMQTYWQEPVAQLSKSDEATLASIQVIDNRLPFPLTGAHPDTGGEFLNWLVVN